MYTKRLTILCSLALLMPSGVSAQQGRPAPHPEAEKAMEKIVLKKDYGENLKFHSREVITMQENPGAPGLNGVMFMQWEGKDPRAEITASVQWFEKKEDLLNFYTPSTKRPDYKLAEFDGTTLWKIGENGYSWTDGEHFLITLGGLPKPPEEMVKDWLALIGSKVAELEKEGGEASAPAEKSEE